MPDLDTPKIAGVLEGQKAPLSTTALPSSKRPRDDGSPVCGKRGKKKTAAFPLSSTVEDGERTTTASMPQRPKNPVSPVLDYNNNPVASPPLCESPSRINQAPSSFAPFSGGEAAKPAAGPAPATAAASTTATAVTRRKGRVPHTAPPSVGATDPIFHAALLRLLHSRNGEHCPEAVGWRWRGDTPARFDHWPCALHPVLMDLLACVSAGEERVVMTGCDKRRGGSSGGCGGGDDDDDDNAPPPREAVWRAPLPRLPRTPSSHHRGTPAAAAAPATPAASTPLRHPTQTPSSALRRPGSSCRLSSKNRVRFSTHDMSVVDTPDPQRGGSEEGMVSALGGLESILSAAERVRDLAARGSTSASGRGHGHVHGHGRRRHYEGYFDRFSAAGDQSGGSGGGDGAVAAGEQEDPAPASAPAVSASVAHVTGPGGAGDNGEPDKGSVRDGAMIVVAQENEDNGDGDLNGDADADAYLTNEAKNVREDSAALVAVLEQIASSDSAPDEVALAGGWGPEHSNAAAFYAKELALLCGATAGGSAAADAVTPAAGVGAGFGSQLRGRYLDVLSCLVRYNLKLLLNTCECELPQEEDGMDEDKDEDLDQEQEQEQEQDYGEKDDNDNDGESEVRDGDHDDDSPTVNLPSPPSSPPSPPYPTADADAAAASAALTVIVPGRASLRRQRGRLEASWGSSVTFPTERGLCGCVSVLDDKGALEFNSEDVAALLTLALGRVHPFMPLVARITVAAQEAGWDGGAVAASDGKEDGDGDVDTLDARVWAAVQQFTLECRETAAASCSSIAAADASSAAATPSILFSSPFSAGTMPAPPPPPPPPCRSAEKPDGPAGSCGASGADGSENKGHGEGDSGKGAALAPAPASPTDNDRTGEDGPTMTASSAAPTPAVAAQATAGVELTVDEAVDLLEFLAAARFIAQLIAEPVVSAGISAGRWSSATRLAEQVRKLAEEEQEAQRLALASGPSAAEAAAAPTSSLSNMVCLGALADVQGLGLTMAQQARYAPALEAALKKELRQALRRGQGLKRRIRHRLQLGAPDVFTFPLIVPACQLVHHGYSHDAA
eukprot:g13645.t1